VAEAVNFLRLIRFGIFEVDLQSGELRKAGVKLKLTGQPFQVLAILLEHPGEIVAREELQKRLWPDTFVDVDHNLIWNDLSTRNSVLSFFFHSCSSQEAAQVAVGEAITTIDHSDIRGSEPHNRDPSGAASD
jgi:hypothetical protein